MHLKDKVAIVTGASTGIGRATAVKLAQEGCRVVINYNTDIKGARETQMLAGRKNCILFQADVGKVSGCKKLAEAAVKEFGKIDILVNNAGITLAKPLAETSEEDWEACITTNLKGPFFLSKYASEHMRNGSIINISSIRAFKSRKTLAVYAASKAGIIGMTKSMAIDLAEKNIRVNAVVPGVIETERAGALPQKLIGSFKRATLLKRMGKPEEIANVVAFLASEESSYIDGAAIIVDGGASCW